MNPWQTTVVVASGPSLTLEQCELARAARAQGRCRIIVVNDNYRLIPDACALYAADGGWWKLHIEAVRATRVGACWTQDHTAAGTYGLHWIEPVLGNHLLPRGDQRITLGSNSGFQALMLARIFGAARILLCGFDMKWGPKGKREHWFGPHPSLLPNGDPTSFVRHFDAVAPALAAEGTRILNCSVATALECFPRTTLEEALCLTETA